MSTFKESLSNAACQPCFNKPPNAEYFDENKDDNKAITDLRNSAFCRYRCSEGFHELITDNTKMANG